MPTHRIPRYGPFRNLAGHRYPRFGQSGKFFKPILTTPGYPGQKQCPWLLNPCCIDAKFNLNARILLVRSASRQLPVQGRDRRDGMMGAEVPWICGIDVRLADEAGAVCENWA
jgi:hypothetical protein